MSLGLYEYIKFINGESIDSIIGNFETNTTIDDILNYDNSKIEQCHYFIQWIFPTNRESKFNDKCPILSKDDINSIKNNPKVIDYLNKFKSKFFEYWGIEPLNIQKISVLNGHNGLRLSRAIECLNMFDIDIQYIIHILIYGISIKILKPSYCNNKPIWFIRYDESL